MHPVASKVNISSRLQSVGHVKITENVAIPYGTALIGLGRIRPLKTVFPHYVKIAT